jgi:mannose-6-phosphate isomerase-like protein (cupin superfamily)
MRVRALVPMLALAVLVPHPATAQDAAEDILREQIELVLHGMPGVSIDRQLKVVGLGQGDGNVAVGILHRTPDRDSDGVHSGLVHVDVSEVYVMLSGWGTLLTSSEMTNATEPSAGGDVVGPSFNADAIGGTIREIHEGDVVVIPAGTLHTWLEIPDHVTYLSVRPDPHAVLPAGYVRPEIR